MITRKVEAKNMTMSTLVLSSLEKIDSPVAVNLDDSAFRD